MEFRLTYEGKLLGSSNDNPRPGHKHEIRMKLHPQLKRLWAVHQWLVQLAGLHYPNYRTAIRGQQLVNPEWAGSPTYIQVLAENYQSHGRNWAPLIGEEMGLTCGVHILFLRPGARGGVLNVGDIDGRLKTLFDAMAIPRSGAGLPAPEADQPIYVLLNDDCHISQASVETAELLEPTSPDAGQNDSRVIITVTIKPLRANFLTVGFSSL
jgi:hypothetical protein